jgi:hypothetical protein
MSGVRGRSSSWTTPVASLLTYRLLVAHMDDAIARLTGGPVIDGAEPAAP